MISMLLEILIMMTMMVFHFVEIGGGGGHSVHFVEILKFWSDLGAGVDFLGVALVQSIDKGSVFGLGYSTNR